MKWLAAALIVAFAVCVAGFSYSSGLITRQQLAQLWRTDTPLPLPPVPPPWHVVALLYLDGKPTLYEPGQRWDEPLECWLEVTRINLRWRKEDRIGVATCRE